MQSLGNDFVVLDGVTSPISMTPEIARKLADRHFGVGCDQILLAENDEKADFRFRIFNQDGSEVEQCGNGARCFARFLRDSGLSDTNEIRVRTINTDMVLNLLSNGDVRVELGVPEFDPALIPFVADAKMVTYPLDVNGSEIGISALAVGNPHAVQIVEDIERAAVLRDGPIIESHPRFPARVNAGFMQIVSPQEIRLRVFERGVGETLGCGSGACAAVIAGIIQGFLDASVLVNLPGGQARVEWHGEGSPVFISGSAHHVFSGEIALSEMAIDDDRQHAA